MSDPEAERLLAAIDAQAAVDRSGWTAAERSAELIELFEIWEQLNALIRRLAQDDRSTSEAP